MKKYNSPIGTITNPDDKKPMAKKKPMSVLKYMDLVNKNYGHGTEKIKTDAEYAKIEADAKAVYERKNPRPKVEPTIEHSPIGTIKNFDKPKKRVDNWSLIKATAKCTARVVLPVPPFC